MVFELLKEPKQTLFRIYKPEKSWNTKETISAFFILFIESFIFIYTLESWFFFYTNPFMTLLQTVILFVVISFPSRAISKNIVPTIVWHAKILMLPAISCIILLVLLFPLGLINLIVILHVVILIIVFVFFIAWTLAWKLYSYNNLFQKGQKGRLFIYYDELIVAGYLVYFISYYFQEFITRFVRL